MLNSLFACESFKHPKQVGTFVSSSRHVGKRMAQQLNGEMHVLEFGAGTGSITTEILKHLPTNGRLTCFEINPRFCDQLRKIEDRRLKVINDDAKNAKNYLDYAGCIVSALPLTIADKNSREQILEIASKASTFIQLQYTPFLAKRLKALFPEVRTKFVLFNIPPVFIYICNGAAK